MTGCKQEEYRFIGVTSKGDLYVGFRDLCTDGCKPRASQDASGGISLEHQSKNLEIYGGKVLHVTFNFMRKQHKKYYPQSDQKRFS